MDKIKNADVLECLANKGLTHIIVNDKFFEGIKIWTLKSENHVCIWFTKEQMTGLEYLSEFQTSEESEGNSSFFHVLTHDEHDKNKLIPLEEYFALGDNFNDVNLLVEFLLQPIEKVEVVAEVVPKEEVVIVKKEVVSKKKAVVKEKAVKAPSAKKASSKAK